MERKVDMDMDMDMDRSSFMRMVHIIHVICRGDNVDQARIEGKAVGTCSKCDQRRGWLLMVPGGFLLLVMVEGAIR